MIRDPLNHQLVKDLRMETESHQPMVVFMNGEYWGMLNMREKYDNNYFKQVYNIDDVDLIENQNAVQEGDIVDYNNMYSYISSNSFTIDANYAFIQTRMDTDNFIDYFTTNIFAQNDDWPGNNIKIVRSNKTGFRYRFCTIDLELCLNPNGWTSAYDDHIAYMLGQSPDNPFINIWLKGIQNNRFRDYFINRFADVMNTEYHTDRLLPLEQYFFDQTVVEMQNEYARWGDPSQIPQQMTSYYNNHITFRDELSVRSSQVRQHIRSNFNLPNQVNLTLNVHPEGAGKIHISTIEPSEYPWQGIYFNGVPIKIEAIPNPGYIFANWGANPLIANILNAVYLDTLDTYNTTFDAYFDVYDLGIDEKEISTRMFSLYPNPAVNSLTIFNKS
jgi:hypothetical protein